MLKSGWQTLFIYLFAYLFTVVLGIKPSAMWRWDKHATTEPHTQLQSCFILGEKVW
jgi:hypothetical protein